MKFFPIFLATIFCGAVATCSCSAMEMEEECVSEEYESHKRSGENRDERKGDSKRIKLFQLSQALLAPKESLQHERENELNNQPKYVQEEKNEITLPVYPYGYHYGAEFPSSPHFYYFPPQ